MTIFNREEAEQSRRLTSVATVALGESITVEAGVALASESLYPAAVGCGRRNIRTGGVPGAAARSAFSLHPPPQLQRPEIQRHRRAVAGFQGDRGEKDFAPALRHVFPTHEACDFFGVAIDGFVGVIRMAALQIEPLFQQRRRVVPAEELLNVLNRTVAVGLQINPERIGCDVSDAGIVEEDFVVDANQANCAVPGETERIRDAIHDSAAGAIAVVTGPLGDDDGQYEDYEENNERKDFDIEEEEEEGERD
ncbi:hypothetical protein ACLOJK_041194 [Asimina triloba]